MKYVDVATHAWIVNYHCGYIDRRGRVQSNTFTHPTLFTTRDAAMDECVEYVSALLDNRIDAELLTAIGAELERKLGGADVIEMLDQHPGFRVTALASVPSGLRINVLIECRTVRRPGQCFAVNE